MASSTPNKAIVARAAAVLTASEVACAPFDLNNAWASKVNVQLDFTLGSLTNAIVKHYVSADGVTWMPFGVADDTVTTSGSKGYSFANLAGWKWYRASLTGTGTVTGSSAAVTYRYLKRGSQS